MISKTIILFGFAFAIAFGYQNDINNHIRTNQTVSNRAVFCYLNGSRLVHQSHHDNYQSIRFSVKHINVDLCTHLVYGAAVLDRSSWGIRAIDPDLEKSQSVPGRISFEDIVELKNQKRDLQVLISVSGFHKDFSEMSEHHVTEFIQNVKNFFDKYKFDGINIDWQYPGRRGHIEDKNHFSTLMKELKHVIRADGKLLTATVPPINQAVIDGYEVGDTDMLDLVDYWFILAVEYYGHGSSSIGANAPIQSRERHSVEKTIKDLKDHFQKHSYKLVLVIPFYGKIYQLTHPLQNNYDSPINKQFTNARAPLENVILTYREICQKMNNDHQWVRGWDQDSKTPYIVKDTQTILYEDAESVQAKTNLALSYNLGGVMAFSIEMDDYDGECSSTNRRNTNDNYNHPRERSSRKNPLLQAMYDTIERGLNSSVSVRSTPLGLVLAFIAVAFFKLHG